QSRGWRRYRAACAGKNGLIPLQVVGAISAFDIRRQWHMTDRVDSFIHRRPIVGPYLDDPPAIKPPLEYLRANRRRPFKANVRSCAQLLSRVHERFPAILGEPLDQQTFDSAAAWHTMANKTRGKYPGIVHNEEIAVSEKVGKAADRCVRQASGVALEDQ